MPNDDPLPLFYWRQSRGLKGAPYFLRRESTGLDQYAPGRGYLIEQETTSSRGSSSGTGTPVSGLTFDPYAGFLRRSAEYQLADNKGNLVTPIVVGGKEVAYAPHRDNGHAFLSRKRSIRTDVWHGHHYTTQDANRKYFAGPYMCFGAEIAPAFRPSQIFQLAGFGGYTHSDMPLPSSQTDLASLGKKAVSLLSPGLPDSSLFTAAGELALAVPQFLGQSLFGELRNPDIDSFIKGGGLSALTRGSAGEFLNIVFGVLPTLDDAIDIVAALAGASEKLLLLERNSGHGVRKNMKFTFDDQYVKFEASQLQNHGYVAGGASGHYYRPSQTISSSSGTVPGTKTSSLSMASTRKAYFNGSFSRFLPAAPGLSGSMERFLTEWDLILGLKPSPDRIWQLIPFSWLVDWFLDIQSSLSIAERLADDNLVINYGYLSDVSTRTVIQDTSFPNSGVYKHSFSRVRTRNSTVIQERVRANAFGFITQSQVNIDPLKIAILLALGITGTKQN